MVKGVEVMPLLPCPQHVGEKLIQAATIRGEFSELLDVRDIE